MCPVGLNGKDEQKQKIANHEPSSAASTRAVPLIAQALARSNIITTVSCYVRQIFVMAGCLLRVLRTQLLPTFSYDMIHQTPSIIYLYARDAARG